MTMNSEASRPGQEPIALLRPPFVKSSSALAPTMAGGDDADLVSAMARGDARALAELYDRHAGQMLALAQKIVRNEAAAEDLLHEVFLQAWEKAASYDPRRGAVLPWLIVRIRSRCLDFLRAASQSRTSGAGDDFWTECAHLPASDESLAPDRAAVRRALGNLPEPQREALFLGYFEGLTCTEIAARVGAPVGTVKTRVAAALARLRDALEDREGGHR
jgi:RNA polymerase sigma-70 factor (ECF subfamily)